RHLLPDRASPRQCPRRHRSPSPGPHRPGGASGGGPRLPLPPPLQAQRRGGEPARAARPGARRHPLRGQLPFPLRSLRGQRGLPAVDLPRPAPRDGRGPPGAGGRADALQPEPHRFRFAARLPADRRRARCLRRRPGRAPSHLRPHARSPVRACALRQGHGFRAHRGCLLHAGDHGPRRPAQHALGPRGDVALAGQAPRVPGPPGRHGRLRARCGAVAGATPGSRAPLARALAWEAATARKTCPCPVQSDIEEVSTRDYISSARNDCGSLEYSRRQHMAGGSGMRRQRTGQGLRFIALACLAFLASACANLTAIREFASTSSDAAQYSQLVVAYVDTPSRMKRYEPESQRPTLDRQVAERKAQQERLLLRQKLIQEYMDALGQLAGDELTIYDKELDALGNDAVVLKTIAVGHHKLYESRHRLSRPEVQAEIHQYTKRLKEAFNALAAL